MHDVEGLTELQIIGRTLKVLATLGFHLFVNMAITMAMTITRDPAIGAFDSAWKLTSLAVGLTALVIAIWKRWYYPLFAVTLLQIAAGYLAIRHINGG